jgi:ABC-type glycerol-3-phosphate transport system substrate-binding protein
MTVAARALSRRRLLVLFGGLAASSALVAACGPTAAPTEAPKAAAPAPTAAPKPTEAPKPAAEATKPAAAVATPAAAATKPAEATKPAAAAEATKPAASPTVAAAAPAKAAPEVELTLGLVGEWDLVGWKALLDELWYKEHPNVKIKIDLGPPTSWAQNLQTKFQAGTGPDVFFLWGNVNKDWWDSGLKFSMDVTDDMRTDPTGWGVRKDVQESMRGKDNKDFQIALRAETIGIWYNKNLFDKQGISPPQQIPNIQRVEWPTFLEWCNKLKSAGLTALATGGAVKAWLQPTIFEYELTFPIWNELYTGKMKYAGAPGVKEGWQMWKDFYAGGFLPQGYFGFGLEEPRALWAQQKAGMLLDGHWQWRDFAKRSKESGFEYGVMPLPSASKDAPFPYNVMALDAFAAWKDSKYKDESRAFLKFLASPPTQTWMVDAWRNISVVPGLKYKEPETNMFAQTLEKNVNNQSLGSAYGQEVGNAFDAQVEPVATGKKSIDDAIGEIQKKIDEVKAKKA